MSKCHQIEILRICKNDINVLINENNNGTFINLTEQNENFIQKLEDYVNYVIEQKTQLEIIEQEKYRIQNSFFNDSKLLINKNITINKEIKDNNKQVYNEQ